MEYFADGPTHKNQKNQKTAGRFLKGLTFLLPIMIAAGAGVGATLVDQTL